MSDFWIISLDRAYAVRSARGIEAEGFDCRGSAQDWIAEREAEAADDAAAQAEFDGQQMLEAA